MRRGLEPKKAKRGSPNAAWVGAKGSEARFPECGVGWSRRRRSAVPRMKHESKSTKVKRGFPNAALMNVEEAKRSPQQHIRTAAFIWRPLQTVKKLGRAREGRSPFELSIVPSGVYGGHGAIFAPENPIFQRKNRFLAGSAPEKSSIFSGDWRGWQWRGSLLPRPPSLSKPFLTS